MNYSALASSAAGASATGAAVSAAGVASVAAAFFERFYKGDAFVQGTGLGLAICRTIVERFHGKIEVASTLGKGSRFAIVLPQEMRE